MKINEKYIVDFLAYRSKRPLKMKEMAKEMNIPQNEYAKFRQLVNSLITDGKLVKIRRGRIGVPSEMNLIVGNISIAKNGKGSITTEPGDRVEIAPEDTFTSLNGDRVIVRISGNAENGLMGQVIKVLDRSNSTIIGIYNSSQHYGWVVPNDKRLRRDIIIPNEFTLKANDGERVVVNIIRWDDPQQNPEGEIIEVLGDPSDFGVDMLTVMRMYNIPEEFPANVVAEAKSIAAEKLEYPQSRINFTNEVTYTIDPFDAKDHDDAISIAKTENGYRLGVYIADVSFYVKDGTLLDKEAFLRGNSVYLPGMVIPMLPEELSNDLCSLKPNRRRLVYAALINFSKNGKIIDWEIVEGIIKSKAKLSYEEVQDFFDTGRINPRLENVAESLKIARELAGILQKNRSREGSLDFDLPEARIVMNKKGEVVEIGNRIRLESHRLVEEFMLVANKVIALNVFRMGQKMLYRVHDKPDMEKLEAFSYMMSSLGYRFPVSENMNPKQFSEFLEKVKGKPEEELINELLLRSMKKAVYQDKNIGHFGLAFKHYTHFTSPIRRYPDLMVHRLLKLLKNNKYPAGLDKKLDLILSNVGRHCSDTERNAEAAERDAIRFKQADYMEKRIGEHYNGVVSGVLGFGFFVRLNDIGAEGMIRLSTLDDDYYYYDEKHYRLVGRSTGRTFRVGDPVRVGVLSVDKTKKEINLFLIVSKQKKSIRGKHLKINEERVKKNVKKGRGEAPPRDKLARKKSIKSGNNRRKKGKRS
ncbi:MAG: ribonuclease R [Candidatus Zixiibacteriota bacterium]